ncbi:MAG: T9SS type A sorting domain-containing protein [Rhodothermaceae bacterium]|nr:T9SS type A sorting domain-containing protein [Rhodothermaceae bacterium]MYC03228.1 T9SS type A sorting domain-containing protein [Rhodothermaceae bacterium]MYI17100.1 T9SS type A sorting domain-containing protein [Rhodothermaceae bacterium]
MTRQEMRIITILPLFTLVFSASLAEQREPIWTAQVTGRSDQVNSVSFSPDGTILASGADDWRVRLWDISSGQELEYFMRHMAPVTSVAFSPDGTQLASSSGIGRLKNGRRSTDQYDVLLWDIATGKELQRFMIPGAFSGRGISLAFSPDGSQLACGSEDGGIYLWDISSGQMLHTMPAFFWFASSVAFSPDGAQVVSGGWGGTIPSISFWDVATGEKVRSFTHTGGRQSYVYSMTFSPDWTQLASGSGNYFINSEFDDHSIRLWDVATGTELRRIIGHSGSVSSVDFSPDGNRLVSGSEDSTVRIWDVETGQESGHLNHGSSVSSIDLSSDGHYLASAGGNEIKLWDWDAVGTMVKEEFPSTESSLTYYPNPAAAFVTIEYSLLNAGHVQLSVHDLLGREVKTVINTIQEAGSHRFQITTDQLPSGMYLLQFISGEVHTAHPLIVHRYWTN